MSVPMPTDAEPVVVVEGDCLDVLRELPDGCVDAVITDPPWGINMDTDYTRFVGGLSASRNHGSRIVGDDEPFNPSPWLAFPHVALWGANCFAERLPVGRWLVWVKKRDNQLGTFMSDAEVCWVNKPPGALRAPGVYVKHHVWHGFDRQTEREPVLHPTQKPVAVMRWTIEMAEVSRGGIILDPFAGSGTTGVAAIAEGRRCILIEKEPKYADICRRRVAEAMGLGKGSLLASLPPASLFGEDES